MRLASWGRLLTIVLLLSSFLMIGARPAIADQNVLLWNRVGTPQDGASGDWVIANNGGAGTEVNRIAVGCDDKTIYALDSVTPSPARLLFKSSDGGCTWTDITGRLPAFSSLDDLAVSPDALEFLIVVDAVTPEVFLSIDGGISFMTTGVAGLPVVGTIQDIAISGCYSVGGGITREIMFGTSNGAGGGQVWVMSVGAQFHNWTDVSTGAAGWAAADTFSLAYSPNYNADGVILVIAADNVTTPGDIGNPGTTWLYIGKTDIAANQVTWNSQLFSGYPVAIAGAGEDSPGTPLTYASLALPSDYSGADVPLRRLYASWSDGVGGNANDDVYRLDDITVVRLYAGNGLEFASTSLAYYGTCDEGRLLAGRQASTWAVPVAPCVQVRSSLDPQARFPTWRDSLKPPTGASEAQVAWSADGEVAFCGTSTIGGAANDESAFSRSTDYGLSWNQTGLIDTIITTINDLEAAPSGDALFMTTVNSGAANADSLWRSTSSPLGNNWERVLARSSAGNGDNPLVRIDPDYADTKVVWYVNTDPAMAFQELFLSKDGGDTYSSRFPNIVLVDLTVEDEETVYGIDAAGFIIKGTNGGKMWGTKVNTYLGSGYSIACARTTTTPDNHKGNVLVGGKGIGDYWDVAYSTDGGATFTPIEKQLPTRDNTLVVASSGYRSDGNILAINSGGMYCWGIFSGKDEWQTWWGGPSWPSSITTLQISRNYGFYFSTPATLWSSATPYVRWSAAMAGLDANINFGGSAPTKRLTLCGGMAVNEPVTTWVIDQRPYNPPQGGIWRYIDTLAWVGPTPTAPITLALIDYEPVSGQAGQINLTWKSRSLSIGYEIQIAVDKDFAAVIVDIGGGWAGPFYCPPAPESPALVIPPGGGTVIDGKGNTWTVSPLPSGRTYYWRVKVQDVATGDAIKSPWSWTESFTVELGLPVRAPYPGPIPLSPINGAIEVLPQPAFCWSTIPGVTEYEFILSRDAAMTDVVIKAIVPTSAYACEKKLEWGKTYFWRVRPITPVPGGWGAIGIFTVAAGS